jgi:hypothetical protein
MGGQKVSGRNVRSFFDRLWESAKVVEHWIRIRIFVGIMSEFLKDPKMKSGRVSVRKKPSEIEVKFILNTLKERAIIRDPDSCSLGHF